MTDPEDSRISPGRALVVWRPAPVAAVPITSATAVAVVVRGAADPDAPIPAALPQPLLARARKSYLSVQWAGPDDRRPPCGLIRREVL